jgi:hypothetical protein
MKSITSIKIWAESSASTLLIEANDGSYDEAAGDLQIRHPIFKAMQQTGLAAHHDGLIVYVDGKTTSLAAPSKQPRPAQPPPPPPRFSRRKMRMKPGHSEGVILKNA